MKTLEWRGAGRVGALLALGGGAVVVPSLSLPAGFLIWLGWLSLPPTTATSGRGARWALVIAALAAGVGFVRFVVTAAVPGIVAGGQRATEVRAVSRLREFVFAEDALRRHAFIDSDRDGVGAAAFLPELLGAEPRRDATPAAVAVLAPPSRPLLATRTGPALAASGYLFVVCLPRRDGTFTGTPVDDIDEERAERTFVAFAWPEVAAGVSSATFATDAYERIVVARPAPGSPAPFVGPARPPACDALERPPPGLTWVTWQGKRPRSSLPGDGASRQAPPG